MSVLRVAAAFAGALLFSSCSIIPQVPNDYAMPINDILHNATCELRAVFSEMNADPEFKSFKASNWLVGVSLSPKTDKEIIGGFGDTGRSNSTVGAPYFNSWAFGSAAAPGGLGDVRGTRNAGVTYNFHSRDLINVKKFPLLCDPGSANYNVLAQHLGIHEWLIRTALAKNDSVGSLASLDKPTYSGEIYVKFSGAGNFTYNFPWGTDFASLSASYDEDITLNIALTPDTQKGTTVVAQALPVDASGKPVGVFGLPQPQSIPTQVNIGAQTRLDTIEQQQQIVNQLKNINTNFRGR